MDAGPITMRCQACTERYDLPIEATGKRDGGQCTVELRIDDADVVLFTTWAQAHRGPTGTG